MLKAIRLFGLLAAVGAPLVTLSACASPQRQPQPSPPSPEPACGGLRAPPLPARERERRRVRLERSIEVAQLNLAKARIAVELGELKYRDAQAAADMEHELAQKRLQIFAKMTAPNRIARAELSLQAREDDVTELQQELYQLELRFKDEQFAEPSGEIVIERARHGLEHAQRDLELRREEFKLLTQVTLPLEQQELEFAAHQKKRAALQVQRENEGALLDRKIAVLIAEAELEQLENDLRDLSEAIE